MKTDTSLLEYLNKQMSSSNTNRFVRDLVFAKNFVQLIECTDPSCLVTLAFG